MVSFVSDGTDFNKKMFSCNLCAFKHAEYRIHLRHLQNHKSDPAFFVKCLSCCAHFTSLVTLKRHLKKHNHMPRNTMSLGAMPTGSEIRSAGVTMDTSEATNNNDANAEEDVSANPMEVEQDNDHIHQERAEQSTSSREAVGTFLLSLKGEANVSNTTCAMVANKMREMCERLVDEVVCELQDGQRPAGFAMDKLPQGPLALRALVCACGGGGQVCDCRL